MVIKYSGPLSDVTGFGEAARNNILALHTAGVEVVPEDVSYSPTNTKFEHADLLKQLARDNDKKPYNVKISHYNPREFPRRLEAGRYNIGYAVWEADQWPELYVNNCNRMDEIWTPSSYNMDGAKASGVSVPVVKVPHTTQMTECDDEGLAIVNVSDETFLFYSILTWQERKNPEALLIAYLTEFSANDDVALLLKVLSRSDRERQAMKNQIGRIKSALNLPSYPKLLFIGHTLDQRAINQLHYRGDSFVMLHRSEGWGLVHFEAMMQGNPVIATEYSGVTEFLNENTGYPVEYRLTPVFQLYEYYNGHQLWADPDIMHARAQMRYVFEHRDEAAKRGEAGREFIREKFAPKVVGELMAERLQQIGR